jgi:ATP-dependent Lon protease, bacterial type
LNKLETSHPQSPDYSILVNYRQTMVDLPGNEYTQDNLSLKHAKKVLDKAHYGMEKG